MTAFRLSKLVAISLTFSLAICWPQTDKNLQSKIVLVRSPDTDEACTQNQPSMAVSVGNENVSIRVGDRFNIITHASGSMSATVIDTCKPSLYFENGLFLFRGTDYIGWTGEYDALLAIAGNNIPSSQVGSVAQIRPNTLQRAAVLDALKGRVSSTDTICVEHATIISPPNSARLFLFVPAEHYDRKYDPLPDDAIVTEGLLFEIRGSGLSVLISETGLLTVYSISDVDNDGVWEMLVHSGGWGGGSYQLRFFDGNNFQKDKLVLYEWSH